MTRICWFCEFFTISPICVRSLKFVALMVPKTVIKSRTWIPASSAGLLGETKFTTTIGVWLSVDDEAAGVWILSSGGILVEAKVSFDSWKYFSSPASIDFVSSFRSFCKQIIWVRAIRTDRTSTSSRGKPSASTSESLNPTLFYKSFQKIKFCNFKNRSNFLPFAGPNHSLQSFVQSYSSPQSTWGLARVEDQLTPPWLNLICDEFAFLLKLFCLLRLCSKQFLRWREFLFTFITSPQILKTTSEGTWGF